MSAHVHRLVVRFGDCDPAGIVYYPRFYDWFHQAMESWFGAIGFRYADLIRERRVGFPAIRSEAEFVAPCPLGEAIAVGLTVAELRTRSLALAFEVTGPEGAVRARGRTVVVCCDLSVSGRLAAIAIPDDVRAAIVAFRDDS